MARWSKEACTEAAWHFTSRGAFKRAYPSAYTTILRRGWDDEVFQHMAPKARRGLTKQQITEIATGFKTRTEFMRGDGGAHRRALDNGWLDDVCAHMPNRRKRWTQEECAVEALKYSTRKAYASVSPSYQKARKHGWLDEVCAHMDLADTTKWNKGACATLAANHPTRLSFDRAHHGAYEKARKKGWLDEICAHMKNGRMKWTKDACVEEALKYQHRVDFWKGASGAWDRALTEGWLDDVCGHMESLKRDTYTKEECIQEASKYETRSEFFRAPGGAYGRAQAQGWLNDICAHMPMVAGKDPCDAIYIWEADRVRFNGKQVYKVGMAIWDRAEERMRRVAARAGFMHRVIGVWHVGSAEARQLEKRVHGIGDDPQLAGFDGATEFRAMDDAELSVAIEMLKKNLDQLSKV